MMQLLRNPWLFGLACLLCGLPVMIASYPPMADMPQHAAQIAALKAMLFSHDWRYESLFSLQAFTPYWLGYGLVMALSVPLGILLAIKGVVVAAQAFFVWAAARYAVRAGMQPAWRWAFLMLPFGFAFQWGFLNFLVAAPLVFLFLGWLRTWRESPGGLKPALQMVAVLHLLFFAHLLVTAFVCIIAVLLLAHPWQGLLRWLRRCLPVFSILPITLAWMGVGMASAPAARAPIGWEIGLHRLVEFLPGLVSAPDPTVGVLLGFLLLALPWAAGFSVKKHWTAWVPFGVYLFFMMFVPHFLGGNYYTYQRFGFLGLPLYWACFEEPASRLDARGQRWVAAGLAALGLLMLGWQTFRAEVFNREVAGYQAVMTRAEPGRRILMLAADPYSRVSAAPVMLHFSSWYQAEQGGLSEFNFARFWGMPLQYKDSQGPGIYAGFEWAPGSFDWDANAGSSFDYLLVRSSDDAREWVRGKTDGRMVPIAGRGGWQLFGKAAHE